MLEKCIAYTIGASEAQSKLLAKVATRAGFGNVRSVQDGVGATQGGGLPFFLVHYDVPIRVKKAMLESIRSSGDNSVRFAPIVVIANDCPFETVMSHVAMGFDDIIVLPEKREIVVQRLAAQLTVDHVYMQTSTYLGPDRRRMEAPSFRDDRRTGDSGFSRLTIRRNVDRGVEIVRNEWCL